MNLNFDHIKVNPQYYFSLECVWFSFFNKLIEIKKHLLRDEIVDFNIRGVKNIIQASFKGG